MYYDHHKSRENQHSKTLACFLLICSPPYLNQSLLWAHDWCRAPEKKIAVPINVHVGNFTIQQMLVSTSI